MDAINTDPTSSDPNRASVVGAGDRFVLGPVLARGGMSTVRAAYQGALRRQIAVKSTDGETASAALEVEANALVAVAGEGVVPVLGFGGDGRGGRALYMELIDGVTWRELIGNDGTLHVPRGCTDDPLDWHLGVLCAVARVLERSHARGVLHRDVKPGNVMIDRMGRVFLLDWGLAMALGDGHDRLPSAATIDRISGTTGHIAPEMVARRALGRHTDIYLLGTCLHVMLTGRPPHDQLTVGDRLRSALRTTPRTYADRVPPALVRIVRRAMAPEPMDRPADASIFRRAIERVIARRAARRDLAEGRRLLALLRARFVAGASVDDVPHLIRQCRKRFGRCLAEAPDAGGAFEALKHLAELIRWAESREQRPDESLAGLRLTPPAKRPKSAAASA